MDVENNSKLRLGRVVEESGDLVIGTEDIAHKGVNVNGRRSRVGIGVTFDHEMFEECVETMRTLKNELETIKEA